MTTSLRYIYDQSNIHYRNVNHMMLVVEEDLNKLTNSISAPMKQLEKLTESMSNWFIPPIL